MANNKLAKIYELADKLKVNPPIPHSKKVALKNAKGCGSGETGAEEYSSGDETRHVPHTCKSAACSECGAKRNIDWIQSQLCTLPNVPWVGITMTMPEQFWRVFRDNPNLLPHLPTFGAHAIEEWTRSYAEAIPYIIVVMQTFNGELVFKSHLHVIVSAGGLNTTMSRWIDDAGLERSGKQIMENWKTKVCDYLNAEFARGSIKKSVAKNFPKKIAWQRTREWHVYIDANVTKKDLLNYDGRYVGRPPISESNIVGFDENGVDFIASVYPGKSDYSNGRQKEHKKIKKSMHYTLWKFILLLTNHLPDRYRHSVRYYGLLAPRVRRRAQEAVESCIPHLVSAVNAKKKSRTPKDSHGNEMHRVRSVSPQEMRLYHKQ
jgi:hypothetical protein